MPPAFEGDVDDQGEEVQEAGRKARRGVREWVRAAGQGTGRGLRKATPYGMYAFLTAAAVAPIAGSALGGADAFGTALDQLGGMGGNYLANLLSETADRMRRQGVEPSDEQWRDAVAEELLSRLEASDDETLHLRGEVGQVLRAVDGISAALTESATHARDLHQQLVGAIAVLGNDFDEFRWMLTELKQALAESTRTLGDVQRELLLARTEQREQGDVTHRFLVAVTKVRQWLRPGGTDEREKPEPPSDGPCPYPGLTSFQFGDAEWFHGRENAVAELLARLAERLDGSGPLVLVGASGAGKSSLLRAGLLPALAAGDLPAADSAAWPRLLLTPGANPLDELAARVATLAGVSAVAVARQLREAPAGFGALARQAALASGTESARLVIVVDQFEELFTQCADAGERLAFATALAHAGPALVVLAVRADFYEQCTRLEPLAPALPDQFVLGPMTPAELHRVVTEPAAKAGLAVESGLAERLVADLGGARRDRLRPRRAAAAGARATGHLAEPAG
ncbi:ATP-binding protein [Amycolatopsis nigrescens]|uniref:ATP-binding protein n=1 Tax=Amycolatopsis nigrescens TaxID=381445 RepID=UPI0003A8B326|nr:ATP-binding protein [Amycolatopsis nigrescens]